MTDRWTTYDLWNEAVLDVVFPELDVPEPVYLDFEDYIVEGLASHLGLPPEVAEGQLIEAVRATLPHLGPAAIFEGHMVRTRRWVRGGRAQTPPFLALLATFSIAAERMAAGDGMASSNYFGRLRSVLGWGNDTTLDTGYRRVAERLWSEHNRWLVELDGQRGLPTAFALSHRYVGLSVSQALVRSADRERLKEFFRQYGFAPGADVPPAELQLVLDSWMGERPCPVSSSLARLWRGQAKERISQAAAVTLAAWDGSVREHRGGQDGSGSVRGHMALTLEMGGFPRRRFALQALMYLPEPSRARSASVITATPATEIELVPDLPGALGLGRGSSLHPGDVLEGVLKVTDSFSGLTVERRPRRLVLFREDELSRRWVESPQVMLGDSVRLLAHESLVPRLEGVLAAIARPGWATAEAYPGQPEGWTVFTGVEVFNHPGELVDTHRMDDLSPLVPLTTTQMKVAGGFSLPGQVRGKWHSWAPPEIRAVSDALDGFQVRVTDLRRFAEATSEEESATEELLVEWDDEGTGVIVQSMSDLQLGDGDFRVDLIAGPKGVISSTTVLLRSAETPDRRQWALVEPVSYGAGVGVLGVAPAGAACRVTGHLVTGAKPLDGGTVSLPAAPLWQVGQSSSRQVASVVRLTMPDVESCLYTGRHRELIDTVTTDAKGKPLQAWSHGRCRGCGLVRRYPTRLPRQGFDRARSPATVLPAVVRHELSHLPAATESTANDWAVAFDAVLHTGGGNWSQLERIALQVEPTALFVDQFARTLEVLGHIDIRRHAETLAPVAWEVAPTSFAGTVDGYLFAGFWPGTLYASIGQAIEDVGGTLAVDEPEGTPASYYANVGREQLVALKEVEAQSVPVVEEAWRDLASVLPRLSVLMANLPRVSDSLTGDVSWFQPRDNSWTKVRDLSAPGAYRVRRFSTADLFRTEDDVRSGTVAHSTVQLGKHLAGLLVGRPMLAYDRHEQCLMVPLGADLPGLYGRAVVAASGRPPMPVPHRRMLRYESVPAELAGHVYDIMRS